jgi:hypothetical protein
MGVRRRFVGSAAVTAIHKLPVLQVILARDVIVRTLMYGIMLGDVEDLPRIVGIFGRC